MDKTSHTFNPREEYHTSCAIWVKVKCLSWTWNWEYVHPSFCNHLKESLSTTVSLWIYMRNLDSKYHFYFVCMFMYICEHKTCTCITCTYVCMYSQRTEGHQPFCFITHCLSGRRCLLLNLKLSWEDVSPHPSCHLFSHCPVLDIPMHRQGCIWPCMWMLGFDLASLASTVSTVIHRHRSKVSQCLVLRPAN